jgi:hypothetical protein
MSGDQFLFVLAIAWAVIATAAAFDQSLKVFQRERQIQDLLRRPAIQDGTAKKGEE